MSSSSFVSWRQRPITMSPNYVIAFVVIAAELARAGGEVLTAGIASQREQVSLRSRRSTGQGVDVVDEFLRIVEQYERNRDNCTPGTTFNLGDGVVAQYGLRRFRHQAMIAVHRANFLTRLWKQNGGHGPSHLDDDYFFYAAVRSMVESDDDLFAAGNCYDRYEYKDYELFCPYAYRLPVSAKSAKVENGDRFGSIMVKDLSVEYKYLGSDSEFFYEARLKAKKKLENFYNITTGHMLYRYNDTAYRNVVMETSIKIEYEDGHWSKPYFDCRGGDIWMMTYTVPFFGYRDNRYYFKGTSGIDIDLQKVDIDQCSLPADSQETNVFAATDKCRPNTTQCTPVPGQGFRRGSYRCECKPGFYFPVNFLNRRYYNGTEVEYQYERMIEGKENNYHTSFDCKPCSAGCQHCIDDSPCILALNWVIRGIVLGFSCVIAGCIPFTIWFTVHYRHTKVLRAASPVLLRLILVGAFLLYCPMIILYFDAEDWQCWMKMWFRGIGFAISYGALLLKTWRISIVFHIKSAQTVKITDSDLIKRLLLIVLVYGAVLSVRMVAARPRVVAGTTVSGLTAYQCSTDAWDYSTAAAELCLLLWGVRLCIVVRKAPSEFNESQFISWAIYNETLLSIFLNIAMFFLQSPANPDVMYIVQFLHTQLTTTVTVAVLVGSKAYMVYKYGGDSNQIGEVSEQSRLWRRGTDRSRNLSPSHGASVLPQRAAAAATAVLLNTSNLSQTATIVVNTSSANSDDDSGAHNFIPLHIVTKQAPLPSLQMFGDSQMSTVTSGGRNPNDHRDNNDVIAVQQRGAADSDVQDEYNRLRRQLELFKVRQLHFEDGHVGLSSAPTATVARQAAQLDDSTVAGVVNNSQPKNGFDKRNSHSNENSSLQPNLMANVKRRSLQYFTTTLSGQFK